MKATEREIKEIYRFVKASTMLPDIYLGIPGTPHGDILALVIKGGKVLVRTRTGDTEAYRAFSSLGEDLKKEITDKARAMALGICRSAPTMEEIISGLGQ